jgi:hypothetical protein
MFKLPQITPNIDKAIYPAITVGLAVLTSLLGANVGFDPATVRVLNIGLLVLTPISAFFGVNGHSPTVPPGHVIVAADGVKPEAVPVFSRPPKT